MANEIILAAFPQDAISGGGARPAGGYGDALAGVQTGFGKGLGFPAGVDSATYFPVRVPNAAALTTGLTLQLLLVDDPLNAGPGKVAVFDVTYGILTSGTSTLDANATTGAFVTTTADSGNATLPATSGVVLVLTITAVVGHTNSLAAGSWCLVRVRRLGTNASDTHPGRVVLLAADVRAT